MTDGSGALVTGLSSEIVTAHPAELCAALAGGMSEGVLIIDAAGRVRSGNTRAIEILGGNASWPGRALSEVGVDYRLVVTVSSCFAHARTICRSLSEGRGELDIQIWAVPLGPASAPDEVALLVRDKSELRRLEAVRRDFMANVSHELRTPAAAIKLMVETLQAGALDDGDAAREFVDRIGQEADHMARMIEELLELSAAESERRVANPVPVTLNALMASIDRLTPLADDRGIEIEVGLEPGVPDVLGDPSRLGQVIRNLVHNAIKFSDAGATVTVSVRSIEGSGLVEVVVADRGRGIPAADLPRIFERFWKGDASRRRDGEGSGLGLAIARHIIEAHGGTIAVTSSPGVGSTFSVSLPATPASV